MQNITQLEQIIINQSLAEDEQTFLYQLHELSLFDKTKFDQLLTNCLVLANTYHQSGKTDNYGQVVKGILLIFEHTLFLFYCHNAEHDYFHISNYGTDLTADDITNYYNTMRDITQKIII